MTDERNAPSGVDFLAYLRRRYFGPLVLFLQSTRVLTTTVWILFLIPSVMDISFPEGAVVARAWDVARGHNPYHDWREWPHLFSPYGPLTYYPVGWVARFMNPEIHPAKIYTIGRIQSVLALIGIATLIWAIAAKLTMPPAWRVLSIAAFMAWEHPLTYVTSYRPDAPQVFFSILALWLALGNKASARRILAALSALSVSMWFKPTAWGIGAAIALWILQSVGWRRMLLSIGIFGAANLTLALIINHVWQGRLLLNMVNSLDNGWVPYNILYFWGFLLAVPRLIFIGGLGSVSALAICGTPKSAEKIFGIGAICSFLSATLLNLKTGADVNYYVECYSLISLAAIYAAFKLWQGAMTKSAMVREALILCICLPLALYDSYTGLVSIRQDLKGLSKGWKPVGIAEAVARVEGPILVMNPFLALQRPAPPSLLDHVQYGILASRGKIDENILLGKIAAKEFRVVVVFSDGLDEDKPSPYCAGFRTTLLANYEATQHGAGLTILAPRFDAKLHQ